MDDDLDKIKKKLKKDFDDMIDVDSDIPISEKKVKDKKFRDIE